MMLGPVMLLVHGHCLGMLLMHGRTVGIDMVRRLLLMSGLLVSLLVKLLLHLMWLLMVHRLVPARS
jgi:hypothetical protein